MAGEPRGRGESGDEPRCDSRSSTRLARVRRMLCDVTAGVRPVATCPQRVAGDTHGTCDTSSGREPPGMSAGGGEGITLGGEGGEGGHVVRRPLGHDLQNSRVAVQCPPLTQTHM